MSDPPEAHPDPWAVIEHHARAAAAGTSDTHLSPSERLTLYVTAAPDVIGAKTIRAPRLVGSSRVWWSAPIPGSQSRLIWNTAGRVVIASATSSIIRRLMIVGAVALTMLNNVRGPREILWALLAAVIADQVAIRVSPLWVHWGNIAAGERANQTLDAFLDRYEEGVTD